MSEELVVRQCAPTLAGIKTGSLFSCPCDSPEELRQEVRRINRLLAGKGLCLLPLRFDGSRALLYLYRPSRLRQDLEDAEAVRLLEESGYPCHSARAVRGLSHPPSAGERGIPPRDRTVPQLSSGGCTGLHREQGLPLQVCRTVEGLWLTRSRAKELFRQYKALHRPVLRPCGGRVRTGAAGPCDIFSTEKGKKPS